MNATLLNTWTAKSNWRLLCAALGLLLLAPAARVPAQNNPLDAQQSFPQRSRMGSMSPSMGDDADPVMQAKRIKALNADRQKALVADTDKLVKLVAELNAEINGAPPSSLTDTQIKKLAEIEKLAHNIREKMSSSINVPTQMSPTTTSLVPPVIQ
jgi:hypothetical protein